MAVGRNPASHKAHLLARQQPCTHALREPRTPRLHTWQQPRTPRFARMTLSRTPAPAQGSHTASPHEWH
ncbi:hypothetical protein Pen01_13460 [Phytomonospora endophytica]|nr:hypothetical protein Pen01_13460 [Phytomonospora endophytica]